MRIHEAWNVVVLTEAANKSLSRFFRHFAQHDIAILTAFRKVDEAGNVLSWNDNLIRNKSLKSEIRGAGYGYIQVKGYYPEVDPTTGDNEPVYEESLVVVDANKKNLGKLRDNAIGWGEKWIQDGVIFKPSGEAATLIGTNDTAGWISRGETKTIGKEHWNVPAEIFTKLKGNRQFNFTEEVDVKQYESYMAQSAKEAAMKRLYGGEVVSDTHMRENRNKMVEMPLRMNTDARPLVKGWDPNKWGDISWENVIGEHNGLTFAQGRMPMGLFGLGILNEAGDGLLCAAKCGMQTIMTHEGPAKGPKFIEVATVPGIRGKGYAKALHDFSLKKWGMIVSDNGLFETSENSGDGMIGLWANYLHKKYKTYVFDEETKKFTPWDGTIDNNENTVYLASTFDL